MRNTLRIITGLIIAFCAVRLPGAQAAGAEPHRGFDEGQLPAGPMCFYGGDLDFRSALSSNRNTIVEESWTFDDVDWPGGVVTEVWGNFLSDNNTGRPVAGDIAVFEGMGEGVWGSEIVQIWDIVDFTWERTGRIAFNRFEDELRLRVNFALPPGAYHVGVRLVGTGVGQAFVSLTSGANAQGGPIANGNSFFQSTYFGFPLPTSWENLLGPGYWDVSIGLCAQVGPGITLSLEGNCPGVMTARINGATPGGRLALIRSAPGRCGGQTTIPPPNPCAGTILSLGGAALVRIITADGEGNAAVTGNVPGAVCGRVCLIALDLTTCEVSNVAEF